MGNVCCKTKKNDDGGDPSEATSKGKNNGQKKRAKKYETNEAQELTVNSPIVNGAERPVDVPDTMLVGNDEEGELRLSKFNDVGDGDKARDSNENDENTHHSVGLVNPGFSSDEDDDNDERNSPNGGGKVRVAMHRGSSSGTSSGAGELSRQSTVKVRQDEVEDYIGQSSSKGKGKVATTEVTMNMADRGRRNSDSDSSSLSGEIDRGHKELFGDTLGFDAVQEQRVDKKLDICESTEKQKSTSVVTMSASDVRYTVDNTVESTAESTVANTEMLSTTSEPSSSYHSLPATEPSFVNKISSDAKLQQDAIDQGYLVLSGATGEQESTDLLDYDGVTLDFNDQSSNPGDPKYNLFGSSPMKSYGHEEMGRQDSMQLSMDTMWDKNDHSQNNPQSNDSLEVQEDIINPSRKETYVFDEPTLEEFEAAEREHEQEVSLGDLTNNPLDKDKLLSSQTIGSERIDYSLSTANPDDVNDVPVTVFNQPEPGIHKTKTKVPAPAQTWGIQAKGMYGSESSSSSSDSESEYMSTRSVNESPIEPEVVASKEHRSSFDLFGAAPHKDMPKPDTFPVVLDADRVQEDEVEVRELQGSIEYPLPVSSAVFATTTTTVSSERVKASTKINEDHHQKSRPPLVRSPQVSVEANQVLLGLDDVLDADEDFIPQHKKDDDSCEQEEDEDNFQAVPYQYQEDVTNTPQRPHAAAVPYNEEVMMTKEDVMVNEAIMLKEDVMAELNNEKSQRVGQTDPEGFTIIHNDLRTTGQTDLPTTSDVTGARYDLPPPPTDLLLPLPADLSTSAELNTRDLSASSIPLRPGSSILHGSEFAAESEEEDLEEGMESDEYDEELNLVMSGGLGGGGGRGRGGGAGGAANMTDEADRELEEIIMELEVIEDALCSDLVNPGFMEGRSDEELGMHVMSQLAQLADLRDLLLNRQPAPTPSPGSIPPTDQFLSEDQIEEWYVSEVGKVNDHCALEILSQKFNHHLDPDFLADVLKEHRINQERYRAIRDVARERLGEDLRDQLQERQHEYPGGSVISSDEEGDGDRTLEEDDYSASENSYNVAEINQKSLAEELGQSTVSSRVRHQVVAGQEEDVMLNGYQVLKEEEDNRWGISAPGAIGGLGDVKEEDIEVDDEVVMDLNYAAVPYTADISKESSGGVSENFSDSSKSSVLAPNSADNYTSGNTINKSTTNSKPNTTETNTTTTNDKLTIPQIITPAQPASSSNSSDSEDLNVDEELRLADLMMNPIASKQKHDDSEFVQNPKRRSDLLNPDPQSDSDSENIQKQYGQIVESSSAGVEPLAYNQDSEATEDEEEDDDQNLDPQLTITLKDTLKNDIRSSLKRNMSSDQFKELMDTYREEKKGLKNIRDEEKDRVNESLWNKLNDRKKRDQNFNPSIEEGDEEEAAAHGMGAQTEDNTNFASVATNTDREVLEELKELDKEFIESSRRDAVNAEEFQELLREHIESTEFLRQQRQTTLLQHKTHIAQRLKERHRPKKSNSGRSTSSSSGSSSSSSDEDEDEQMQPYALRTQEEKIEKQLEANMDRLLARVPPERVSEEEVARLLGEHRARQTQILEQREQTRQHMHDKIHERLQRRKLARGDGAGVGQAVGKMDEEFYAQLLAQHGGGEMSDRELEKLVEEHLERVEQFKKKVHTKMVQLKRKRRAGAKENVNTAQEASRLLEEEREQAKQIARIRAKEKEQVDSRLQEKINMKKKEHKEHDYSGSPSLPAPRRPPRDANNPQRRGHIPTNYENIDLL